MVQIYGRDGGETLVNTVTEGLQFSPEIGWLTSGGYVVAWADESHIGGDADSFAVKAQIYDPAGAKVGGEFLVNTTTSGSQTPFGVIPLAGGGFIIGFGGDGRILTQAFDSTGAKVGGEIPVVPLGSHYNGSIAALASGGHIVAWAKEMPSSGRFADWDIYAQRFDSAGAPVGGAFRVNLGQWAFQSDPKVTGLASGGFVVTWQDGGGSFVPNIRGAAFDSNGDRIGFDFTVNGNAGGQGGAHVAALPGGGFVVVWSDFGGSNSASDGSGAGVKAQLFTDSGTKIGTEFLVNSPTSGDQYAEGVAALPWGGFVVTWEDHSHQSGDSDGSAAMAQVFDADGTKVGGAFLVNTTTAGNQIYSAVSRIGTDGDFVIAWTDRPGAYPLGEVRAQIFQRLPDDGNDIVTGDERANSLDGGDGDDVIDGLGGNDRLDGEGGDDLIRGGAGDDRLLVSGPGTDSAEGGTGFDTLVVDYGDSTGGLVMGVPAGDGAGGFAGTIAGSDRSLGFSGIEAFVITGGSGADTLVTGDGKDWVRPGTGNDSVSAGGGDDTIVFGTHLTAADAIDGGGGVDTLVLQGDYSAGLILGAGVTRLENVSILAGSNTSLGEPGTGRYDYVLATHDSNFAAGVQARINGAALLEGEDFTFDGSAETDASYVVYGGKGKDTLLGGLGNDIFFYAEERFASGDTVNGGAGYDGMFLRGNYSIDFNAPGYTGLFTNIENLTLTSTTDERYARGGGTEFDYNLTLSDAIVGAGQELTISGALLQSSETMIVDASQETNGSVRLFGGRAADSLKGGANADLLHGAFNADLLTGGGGADLFRYQSVTESYAVAKDHILDFTPGTDRIDLERIDANEILGGNQAFTFIGSNAFSGAAGQLRAFQSGSGWTVEGDINGDGHADLIIALTLQGATPLGAADFLL